MIQGTILESSSAKEKVLVQQQQLHGSETDAWRRQVAEVEAQKTDLEKQLREAQHLLSMQEQLQGLFSQEEQATKRQLAVEQQKLARAEEVLVVLESLVVRVQSSLEEQVALQRSSMTGSHELICQACVLSLLGSLVCPATGAREMKVKSVRGQGWWLRHPRFVRPEPQPRELSR
ncbi:MAG: hypothetical protein ACPIOQ_22055, partial [Promethearchaeia archaeon]